MANNLLTEMKNVGINCDIPPNKLRTGYGESVCIVLLKLIDKALEKKKLSFKKPKFDEEKDGDQIDGAPEIEEESPDLINMEIDYGDKITQEHEPEETKIQSEQASNVLYSNIPPEEWQRELEKVSSKLKVEYIGGPLSNAEWRSHIDQIKLNENNFVKAIPDSRSILENLSGDIDYSLEKITKKEEIISKGFTHIVIHFYLLKDKRFQGEKQINIKST